MVSLTLSISQDLKNDMDRFPEMNWSQVARKAIIDKVDILKNLDKLAEKSNISEKDAIDLGRMLKRSAAKKNNNYKK